MTRFPRTVTQQEFADLLGKKGTVWLDGSGGPGFGSSGAADSKPDAESFLFASPIEEITVYKSSDVIPAFKRLDFHLGKGKYVAGYVAYEAGYAFEPSAFAAQANKDYCKELGYPLLWFGVYDEVHNVPDSILNVENDSDGSEIGDLQDAESSESYEMAVEKIRALIAEGDVYQVNYTTRFKGQLRGTALSLFDALRKQQPVQFGAFLRTPSVDILSLSPELFFKRSGKSIEARPMKGTAPRGSTPEEDAEIQKWLSKDQKNQAENLMIVDLLRNDLSVLCQPGSVHVPELFQVVSYPTVHQMVSTVQGTLTEDVGLYKLFGALFPCGSITGAPKIRSMKRISELESSPRGVYCGAIGFAGPSLEGSPEAIFSVGIRTATIETGPDALSDSDTRTVTLGAGGGIVWDSDPTEEYAEALLKTRFVTKKGPKPLQLIETMRCQGGIAWLDFHLDRLQTSAGELGFEWDREGVKRAIINLTDGLGPQVTHKVRLLMSQNGEVELVAETTGDPTSPVLIGLSTCRVASNHPLLHHKTTRRDIYDRARTEALSRNVYDVMLSNERGEITEGSITNIFVKKDGLWFTPPLTSGLLAGVGRRVFMLKNATQERVLKVDDLATADELMVTNAVIGCVPAIWQG